MLLNTILTLDGVTAPPTQDIEMVRSSSHTFDVRVYGIPSGVTLAQLIWTGKADADDDDTAILFQKNITTTTDATLVGQVTDTGTTGTARGSFRFTPADSLAWPDDLVHQMWGILSDNRVAPCLTGAIAAAPPIPSSLLGLVATVTVS